MTPGEAESFSEADEDPQKIFAAFDAARLRQQIREGTQWIRDRYGNPVEPGWYDRGGAFV